EGTARRQRAEGTARRQRAEGTARRQRAEGVRRRPPLSGNVFEGRRPRPCVSRDLAGWNRAPPGRPHPLRAPRLSLTATAPCVDRRKINNERQVQTRAPEARSTQLGPL